MYKIMQSVIHTGNFRLAEMRHKVNKLYIQGDLTEEQADTLLALAMESVSPDAERPALLEMVRALSERVDALAAQVAGLLADAQQPQTYEAWKPWDGISDKYQPGAIVSHGGKLWVSAYTGQNVWEPGTLDDRFWTEYQEA